MRHRIIPRSLAALILAATVHAGGAAAEAPKTPASVPVALPPAGLSPAAETLLIATPVAPQAEAPPSNRERREAARRQREELRARFASMMRFAP